MTALNVHQRDVQPLKGIYIDRDVVASRPAITFDLDGVICRPPLGLNVGIGKNLQLPPMPSTIPPARRAGARRSRVAFAKLLQWLRYLGRGPVADAADALETIHKLRDPVLVTARSALGLPLVERWLRRHGLRDYFSALYANDTGLRGAQFKLHKASQLGAREHVDDDGSTAYYLARHGIGTVYLRDWPRNRGLPYPPNVKVIRSLLELAAILASAER